MVEKIGRPTVMTKDTIAKLEYVFALGGSDLEACFYADISKDTLYRYQQENPDFKDRKEALKEKPVLLARESVIRGMQDDGKLAFDYLKNKKNDEFSTKQKIDENITVSFLDLINETDD